MTTKEELIDMFNKALTLEHQARIQYMTHAQQISGPNAEPIIERLEELASDEEAHEVKFREIIAGYLGGIPTMEMSDPHSAKGLADILDTNLHDEKTAIDYYMEIYDEVRQMREELKYSWFQIIHKLREIIADENEHVMELNTLK
ncbi:MAG: Bacterioferritin (BFR) (Cytochrome B-557.5) [Promethearchaeota archaeon]|jgi:bacterioferritin (cytochrome b1)|nr:MAG: Bacterioferritin (BFR) (Cytochrome B-557.5) [Candidatus Lokiarchaeota archaeon]